MLVFELSSLKINAKTKFKNNNSIFKDLEGLG